MTAGLSFSGFRTTAWRRVAALSWRAGAGFGLWLAVASCGWTAEADGPIRLQLKWRHQFQFAGYYAAQAQGYYEAEGLEVEIIEGNATRSPLPAVLAGEADFGVTDTDVLLARLRGQPVVVCAAIFQHSPYVILSRADRGIRSPHDLVGARVMLSNDQGASQFRAMLAREGVAMERVKVMPHTWRLEDLIEGRVDAMSAYATAEPGQMRARGVEPAMLRTLDYGVDFYGDTLFAQEAWMEANHERAEAFIRASLRGWEYALRDPGGMADHILALPGVRERGLTRELLLEEAVAMQALIMPEVVEIGHMNPGRWRRIADVFVAQGLAPEPGAGVLDDFLHHVHPFGEHSVLRRMAAYAGFSGGVAVLVLLWNLQMRRGVRARTRELRAEIARREEAEREQRELAGRLEAERARLVEAQLVARLGDWETDLATQAVRWSEQTHRIFETDPARVAPSHASFLEFVHPDDRAAVDEAFRESMSGGDETRTIVHRVCLPDGRVKHVEERWRISRDDDGRAVRAIGTCQDITERILAEGRMRLFENSIARLNDMVIITRATPIDEPGPEIVFVNDAFERITGYTRAEALGRSPRMLQGPKTQRVVLDRIRAEIAAGRPAHEELINYGKDGREYWLDVAISPVTDADGVVTHLVAIQRDITERKKLEEQFLRAQRMESIGTLAGGIAHDLNNLLAPILMGVELIRRLEPREDTHRLLLNMERSARRGAELVKQVLSFARGVEGARVSVHLRHIVGELESIVANTFPKNIAFEADLSRELALVTGDPTQLSQVLLNLAVNARDAMPTGGRLSITGKNVEIDPQYAVMNRGVAAGRYVVLEVADTGMGMAPEVIDRIFEPFFTTKEVGAGTGLGLSTVLGIVRSHGGFVNVYSEIGRGSVFKVHLPAMAADETEHVATSAAANLPRGAGELVLIVDDEVSILSVTRQTVEAFGYRALTAEDGAQAIGIFAQRQGEIRAILTDMMMPVMDGPALIAAVRRIAPGVPIIAASGLNTQGLTTKATALGIQHFLAKPYTTEALLTVLHQVLAEERG